MPGDTHLLESTEVTLQIHLHRRTWFFPAANLTPSLEMMSFGVHKIAPDEKIAVMPPAAMDHMYEVSVRCEIYCVPARSVKAARLGRLPYRHRGVPFINQSRLMRDV